MTSFATALWLWITFHPEIEIEVSGWDVCLGMAIVTGCFAAGVVG